MEGVKGFKGLKGLEGLKTVKGGKLVTGKSDNGFLPRKSEIFKERIRF